MDCIYLQEPENLTSICLSFEEQPIIGIVTAILNGHSDVVGLGQAKATCGEPPGGVCGESLHAQGDPSGDTVLSGSDG